MCIEPDSFESTAQIGGILQQQNVLLIGAPDVGKSYSISEDDQFDATVVTSLSEIPSIRSHIVVDSLFTIYQEYIHTDDEELKEKFEDLINLDAGVCYITRPRTLDWAINNQALHNHISLSDLHLIEKKYTREDLEEIAAFEDSLDTDVLDDDSVLEKIRYEYEFDIGIEDYQSYIPWIVTRVSLDDRNHLYPSGVDEFFSRHSESLRETLAGYIGAEGLDQIQIPDENNLDGILTELPSDSETIVRNLSACVDSIVSDYSDKLAGAAGSILGGAAQTALPVVGPLVVSAILSPDNEIRRRETAYDALGNILSGDVLPPTRSVIEEELDLPPMSLESLHTFMDPSVYSRFESLLEFDFDQMETDIETLHADLDAVKSSIQEIEERVEFVHFFISSRVKNSTDDIEDLERTILNAESKYLNLPAADIDIEQIPLHGVDEQGLVSTLISQDSVSIIKGPHGTGKSSTAYQVLSEITKQDVPVRIPKHGIESRSMVRSALAGTNRPPVVFVPYRIGSPDTRIDVDDLTWLLNLVEKNIVRSVLIECRSEYYTELVDQMDIEITGMGADSSIPDVWYTYDPPIELGPLTEEQAIDVISWVAEQKNAEDVVNNDRDHILSITDCNPELTKIATRLACENVDINEIATQDQLVWRDIQNITVESEGTRPQRRARLVKWLATVRDPTINDLEELTELSNQDISEILDTLTQYLNRTEGENETYYQLFPDIYNEIIFRGRCLGSLEPYLDQLDNTGLTTYCEGISENLALLGEAHQRETEDWQECLNDANRVLEFALCTATATEYFSSLEILTRSTFPLDIQHVDGEQIAEGKLNRVRDILERNHRAGQYMQIDSPHPANHIVTPLSRLAGNHAMQENDLELVSLSNEFVDGYAGVTENELPSSINWNNQNQYDTVDTFIQAGFGEGGARVAVHYDGNELWRRLELLAETSSSAVTNVDGHEWSFYCHGLSACAPIKTSPDEIATLMANVENMLRDTQQYQYSRDWERGRALFYANVLHQLMRKHSFQPVSVWPSAITHRTESNLGTLPYLHRGVVEICAARCEELSPPYRWLEWLADQDNLLYNALDEQTETVFGNYRSPFHLLRDFFSLYIGFVISPNNAERSNNLIELLRRRINEMSDEHQDIAEGALTAVQDVHDVASEMRDE